MTSLQVLDIGGACGICGNLPLFPQAVIGRPQVESTGSSLGWNCQRGQCSGSFPISIVAQAGVWVWPAVISCTLQGNTVKVGTVRRLVAAQFCTLSLLRVTHVVDTDMVWDTLLTAHFPHVMAVLQHSFATRG